MPGFTHSPVKFENNPNDQCLPFTLDLPLSHVKFIDKHDQLIAEGFKRAVETCILCGIDTETKPQFFPSGSNGKGKSRKKRQEPHPTALIQIAVRCSDSNEYVFILDLLALLREEDQTGQLDTLLEQLFSESSIVKVGQGLAQDLREMRDSYPFMKAFRKMTNIVDTNAFHKLIQPDVTQQVSLKNFTRYELLICFLFAFPFQLVPFFTFITFSVFLANMQNLSELQSCEKTTTIQLGKETFN